MQKFHEEMEQSEEEVKKAQKIIENAKNVDPDNILNDNFKVGNAVLANMKMVISAAECCQNYPKSTLKCATSFYSLLKEKMDVFVLSRDYCFDLKTKKPQILDGKNIEEKMKKENKNEKSVKTGNENQKLDKQKIKKKEENSEKDKSTNKKSTEIKIEKEENNEEKISDSDETSNNKKAVKNISKEMKVSSGDNIFKILIDRIKKVEIDHSVIRKLVHEQNLEFVKYSEETEKRIENSLNSIYHINKRIDGLRKSNANFRAFFGLLTVINFLMNVMLLVYIYKRRI
ncbi:hypothetical protein MHBO_001529 [Bonamia ostreae]|uniref:Uncharacterized protein n=2 Tax=Bonamia ostreae TaxID=126728 RepID=A0ABV2AJC0_9EUKA